MQQGPTAQCATCGLPLTAASADPPAIEAARSVYVQHLVNEHKLPAAEAAAIADAWARSAPMK